ncbi:MAG TPA: hypothetical protein PKU80_06785 [Candidatus Limiplasma sp.]|nr:hypothetical protein [Candidatus Limiplasma sp.]
MKQNLRRLTLGFLCLVLAALILPAYADSALFEAAVSLQSGAEPTQFRVYASTEHAAGFPDDPALLAEVTPPAGDPYTFLFPSDESNQNDILPLLRFTDMNGDGNLDVEAVFVLGASNLTCTYYLFDPADGQMHYSAVLGALANAVYDAQLNVILSQVSDGAATQYYSLFDLAEGVPVLARTAWMDAVPQGDAYTLSINVTSAITGEVLLEDSVPFQDDESALWNAQYDRMMLALLDGYAGIPATEQP